MVFAVLVSMLFGMVDYLYGYLQEIPGFKAEGLYYMCLSLLWGQLIYLSAGAALGILFAAATLMFRKFLQPRQDLFGIELGILTGIFAFLLLAAITPSGNKWRLFVTLDLAAVLAVFIGYGVKVFWSRFLGHWLGGPVKGIFILTQALLLAAALIMLWILKLPIYDRAKVFMLAAAAGVFFLAIFWARFCFRKKNALAILAYLATALICLSLPLLGYRGDPKVLTAGKPKNELNIIWIIADACRADNLGIYSGNGLTPNLDQLGREGVLFKNAYSNAPWTVPSMLSMTSSLYPSIFQSVSRFGISYGASPKLEFFSERLQKYGYQTRAVTANYLLGNRELTLRGFDRGDTFYYRYRLQRVRYYRVILKVHYLTRRFLGLTMLPDTTRMVTEKGQESLREARRPFFLYLHFMNPHDPYNPPGKYLKQIKYQGVLRSPFYVNDPFHLEEDKAHPQEADIKMGFYFLSKADQVFIRDLNLGNVRYLDEKIGELMKTIRELGLEQNTVVIFAADHGEEFWEHDQWAHGHSLYDELLHIPLIIRGPGLKPRVIEEPVAMINLVPTLAELIGIAPNPDWQGKSFLPALIDETYRIAPEPIFAEGTIRPEELKAVRTPEYKMIIGAMSGKRLLFNLAEDPKELKNIYQQDLSEAEALREKIKLWQARDQTLKSKLQVRSLTPEERKEFDERLRAAGYIK